MILMQQQYEYLLTLVFRLIGPLYSLQQFLDPQEGLLHILDHKIQ